MYDKFLSPDVMPLMCIQNFPLTIVKLYVYVFLSIDNFSDYKKKKIQFICDHQIQGQN